MSDYTGPDRAVRAVGAGGLVADSRSAPRRRTSVFGLGGKIERLGGFKDAAPWTDPTFYFIRNSSSGSTVLTAQLIDVPKTKFWGIDRLSTDNLRDSMLASTEAEASIGILSIVDADTNRGNLRSLYLQSPGQICGYLPDSNKNSFDKMNVRDGHYPLWGYRALLHAGRRRRRAVGRRRRRSSRASPIARLDQSLIDNIIAASLVPQCAMKVVRTGEEGDVRAADGPAVRLLLRLQDDGQDQLPGVPDVVGLPGRSLGLQLRLLRSELTREHRIHHRVDCSSPIFDHISRNISHTRTSRLRTPFTVDE